MNREGNTYTVISDDHFFFKKGSVIVMVGDDGSDSPFFNLVEGSIYSGFPFSPDDPIAVNMVYIELLTEGE